MAERPRDPALAARASTPSRWRRARSRCVAPPMAAPRLVAAGDATRASTARCSPGTRRAQPGVLVRGGAADRACPARTRRSAGRLAVTTGSTIEVQSTSRRRLRARASPRPAPTRSPSRRRGSRGACARATPTRSTRRRSAAGAPPREVARAPELGRPALAGGRARLPPDRPHAAGSSSPTSPPARRPPRARSAARCCSTRRCTAAGCSTCARPTRARSCGSARSRRARAAQRPRAAAAPCRPAAATPATSRAAHHTPRASRNKPLWRAPARAASSTRCGRPRSRADAAYVTRLRQVAGQPLHGRRSCACRR